MTTAPLIDRILLILGKEPIILIFIGSANVKNVVK